MTKQLIGSSVLLCSTLAVGCAVDVSDADDETSDVTSYAATRDSDAAIWSNGRIPYVIDSGISAADRAEILDAMTTWQSLTPYRFFSRGSEPDYVWIHKTPDDVCTLDSLPGKRGGVQRLLLGPNCHKRDVIHNLGHVVGLWNEQQRIDRDNNVVIHWENIPAEHQQEFETYFERGDDGRSPFGTFDFDSIMLDRGYAFTVHETGYEQSMSRRDNTVLVVREDGISDLDAAGATNALTQTSSTAFYRFVNAKTSMCLDLKATDRARGVLLVERPCSTASTQRWYFYDSLLVSNLMINGYSGQCLDIPGSSQATGKQAQQFPCKAGSNQGVSFHSVGLFGGTFAFQMIMDHDGRCLGTDSQHGIVQSDCHGASSTDQVWTLLAAPQP